MVQLVAESTAAQEELTALQSLRSIDADQLVRLRASNEELLSVQDDHTTKTRQHQEDVSALTASLAAKDESLASLRSQLDTFENSRARAIKQLTLTLEQAQEDGDRRVRDLNRVIKDQTRRISSLEKSRDEERAQYEAAIADRAEAELSAQLSGSRLDADSGELERLSRALALLKVEDAKKEGTIMRLMKARGDLKADLESSEIALESKQQELELVSRTDYHSPDSRLVGELTGPLRRPCPFQIKRKFGVRGVAGSTPAPNRTLHPSVSATPATARRQSSAFTPAPASATPSSTLDTPGPLARTAAASAAAASAARPRSSLAMGTPSVARTGPPRSRSSLGVSSSSLATSQSQSLAVAPATTAASTRRLSARPSVSTTDIASAARSQGRFSLGPAPPTSSSAATTPPMTTDDSPTTLSRSLKSAASSSSLRKSSAASSSSSTNTAPLGASNSLPSVPQATPRRASLAPSAAGGRRQSMTPAMKTPSMGPPTSSRTGGRVMVRREKDASSAGAGRIEEGEKENEEERGRGMMLA